MTVGEMGVASALVGMGVGVSVGVSVGVAVAVGVFVAVGVGVGVGSNKVNKVRASNETGSLSGVYGLSGPKMTTRSVTGPNCLMPDVSQLANRPALIGFGCLSCTNPQPPGSFPSPYSTL